MKVTLNKYLLAKTMETDNSKANLKIKISIRKRKNYKVAINNKIKTIKIGMVMMNLEGLMNKLFKLKII